MPYYSGTNEKTFLSVCTWFQPPRQGGCRAGKDDTRVVKRFKVGGVGCRCRKVDRFRDVFDGQLVRGISFRDVFKGRFVFRIRF